MYQGWIEGWRVQSMLRDGEPRHQMRMLMYLQDRKHPEQIYPFAGTLDIQRISAICA
jgi:hypothetical protein